MKSLEKYTFKRINKDIHPLSLSTDGQRRLVPGNVFHVENGRMTSSQDGNLESVENILGNEEIVNSNLPLGLNKTIGTYEDIENFSIIIFIYNSLGNHSIHRFFGRDNSFELILEWSGLSFTGEPIRGVGIAGNHLYWTDGGSPHSIDMGNLGLYSQVSEDVITLYKKPPIKAPKYAGEGEDESKNSDRISGDNFQFSYRYLYKDGSYSTPSTWSTNLAPESVYKPFTKKGFYYEIEIEIEENLISFIDEVEVFYRKNQSENTYFFERIKKPSKSKHTVRFYNDVSGFQLEKTYDKSDQPIPVKSNCLAYFKDRLFVTNNETGRDIRQASLTSSVKRIESTFGGQYFKHNGVYGFGFKLKDGQGKSTLVEKIGELQFPNRTSTNQQVSNNERAEVIITGSVPEWAETLDLVLTPEKTYGQYAQFTGFVLGYIFDKSDLPEGDSAPGGSFLDGAGRYYEEDKIDSNNKVIKHIICPSNLPFEPTKGMFIRCLSNPDLEEIGVIGDFLGNRIVTSSNFGLTESAWDSIDHSMMFEIFTLSDKTEEDLYFEIGRSFDVSNGTVNIKEELEGDVTILDNFTSSYDLDLPDGKPSYRSEFKKTLSIESPTATTVRNSTPKTTVIDLENDEAGFLYTQDRGSGDTPDYTKKSNDFGRAFVEQRKNGTDSQPNKISFSDTYIQDSFINGLHNFDTSNTKSIPRELGPITKLLPIGGNIMLAIHERECSSLSIGEGFMKVGDESFILQKTESVIGDERNLLGGYGTIYPESAKTYEGVAFFYDIFKGSICRYTVNGLYPVSKYGMQNYFEEKSKQLLPYRDEIQVVAGIDPFHKEYVITFPAIDGIPAETWGFNFEKNEWNSKYPFIPDTYAALGNRFMSFKDGKLYEHYKGDVWNNFYGVQYERKIIFYVNPNTTATKRLLNAHILASEIAKADDPEYKVLVIRTPNGQESYVKLKHIEKKEQTFYTQFFKDINTEVESGKIALLDGRDVRDKYFEIEINCNLNTKALLHEISIVTESSEYSR